MGSVKYKVPERWIRDYLEPRYPELVQSYREAGTITETAIKTGKLDDTDLTILLQHLASSKTVLSDNVGDMLGKLANLFPSVQHALEKMAQSSKAGLRTRALLSLLHMSPCALHERMYAAALKDDSKKIRMLSAQCIEQQAITALLPALSQAIERESDAETRQRLHYSYTLLHDGYWVDTKEDGVVWVRVRNKGSVSSRIFSTDQFESEGKAWIAARVSEWKKK